MTLRMLDSIYASNLPSGADAYLGYPDGFWPDYEAIVAKFPGVPVVSLTVFPGYPAEGCDCESGDLTVAQVPPFIGWRLGAGVWRPISYSGAANVQPILAGLATAGIARSSVRILSAHYGAGKHICGPATCGYPQADGTQWRSNAPGLNGSLIDESLLSADFFGPPPPPPPPPPSAASRIGDTMFTLPNGAGAVLALPAPTAVLTVDGQIAPPSSIRFASNSPASLSYMLGNSGTWIPLAIDYARSPTEIPLGGALAVKVQRVDGAPNFVTGDFA